uniref:Putative secreted protein n=1 Tax=Ixodes scapularis TaxID=6945 RepID=A0A4D5S066_IXOSC
MGSLFFFFLFFYLGFHVLEQTNLLARVLFPTLFLPNSILFSLQLRVLAACARFSDPFFTVSNISFFGDVINSPLLFSSRHWPCNFEAPLALVCRFVRTSLPEAVDFIGHCGNLCLNKVSGCMIPRFFFQFRSQL